MTTTNKLLEKYPWLNVKEQDMVFHNDLDGILTALLFHECMGHRPIGMYDLESIHTLRSIAEMPRKEKNQLLCNAVYVDLDIYHKAYKSIGHHIVMNQGDHLNINHEYGIDQFRYQSKYPLNTALFTYKLYGKELPKSDEAMLFLLSADNVWKNYHGYEQRYKQNVITWLKKLEMHDVLEYIKSPNLVAEVNRVVIPKIEEYIRPRAGGKENYQCGFGVGRNGFRFYNQRSNENAVQQFTDYLADIFDIKRMVLPTDIVTMHKFQTDTDETVTVNNFEQVVREHEKTKTIFSMSLKNKNILKFTYSPKSVS